QKNGLLRLTSRPGLELVKIDPRGHRLAADVPPVPRDLLASRRTRLIEEHANEAARSVVDPKARSTRRRERETNSRALCEGVRRVCLDREREGSARPLRQWNADKFRPRRVLHDGEGGKGRRLAVNPTANRVN